MKKFHLTESYCTINFDTINYHSQASIVKSDSFELLLKSFIRKLKKDRNIILSEFRGISFENILTFYRLLLIYELDEVFNYIDNLTVKHQNSLYELTEMFYDYWRSLERFGLLKGSKKYDQAHKVYDLIKKGDEFNDVVIKIYRNFTEKLLGRHHSVYRQLPAGINANLLYVIHKFSNNLNYHNIQNIPFITKIAVKPPFIINSKSNTRSGIFKEIKENPINKLSINKKHYISFPVKVGPLLAFVYIHRDFLHHGVALSNLFEFANYDEFNNRKPDLIYLYGIKENEYDCTYFYDTDEDLYLGFVSRSDKNDYFGYLKKMLLTLHNLKMINQEKLPIHGAMVSVLLKNNRRKNICVVGDSGAGKSETLEALRVIGKDLIKDMQIVFDDMGTFTINNNQVYGMGTEIGAFVRLDDLDSGYAYQVMDRAIFLNPNQKNARVVIPISSYSYISSKHKIDLFLYANNYEEKENGLKIFDNTDEALTVFKEGVRKAKGTTSEIGIVKSFFANPFGPVQEMDKTNVLLKKYFNLLFKQNVIVGEIYTKIAVDGFETKGPLESAKLLIKYLEKK